MGKKYHLVQPMIVLYKNPLANAWGTRRKGNGQCNDFGFCDELSESPRRCWRMQESEHICAVQNDECIGAATSQSEEKKTTGCTSMRCKHLQLGVKASLKGALELPLHSRACSVILQYGKLVIPQSTSTATPGFLKTADFHTMKKFP